MQGIGQRFLVVFTDDLLKFEQCFFRLGYFVTLEFYDPADFSPRLTLKYNMILFLL